MSATQCSGNPAPAQLALLPELPQATHPACGDDTPHVEAYDHFVVGFSGGKDSVACVLHLLDLGVPRDRIELHHHLVDGYGEAPFMDWPVTESYCRAFARAFELNLYFSWKEGGFKREMLRNQSATAPIRWQKPDLALGHSGGAGPAGTRLRFPQVSADLSVRWCSSYLKIDVCASLLRNESRFAHGKTLVVTGERAEESSARAKYHSFEPHRTDNRNGVRTSRYIDHWRPVHSWTETEVWSIIERYRVNPHPAYHLGWGRTSCALCIFGNARQLAAAELVLPEQFATVANFEEEFGVTIKRKASMRATARAHYQGITLDPIWTEIARSRDFTPPILVDNWTLPSGAFGDSSGPT